MPSFLSQSLFASRRRTALLYEQDSHDEVLGRPVAARSLPVVDLLSDLGFRFSFHWTLRVVVHISCGWYVVSACLNFKVSQSVYVKGRVVYMENRYFDLSGLHDSTSKCLHLRGER